jgi:hypothetical protein
VTAAEATKFVAVVIDSFLDFVQQHRAPHTYRWYKDRLRLFLNTIPPDLRLDQFKPFHVQKWIDAYPELSNGSKRNYCRTIMRAMTWAEEQGYIARSPLAHFNKPGGGRKEQVVSPADKIAEKRVHQELAVFPVTHCRIKTADILVEENIRDLIAAASALEHGIRIQHKMLRLVLPEKDRSRAGLRIAALQRHLGAVFPDCGRITPDFREFHHGQVHDYDLALFHRLRRDIRLPAKKLGQDAPVQHIRHS